MIVGGNLTALQLELPEALKLNRKEIKKKKNSSPNYSSEVNQIG